jgi:hypothetical protein
MGEFQGGDESPALSRQDAEPPQVLLNDYREDFGHVQRATALPDAGDRRMPWGRLPEFLA